MAAACEAGLAVFAVDGGKATCCVSDTECPFNKRSDPGGCLASTAAAGIAADGVLQVPRTKTYYLFGRTIALIEGDSELSNTGWKVWAGSWLLAKYFEEHLGPARRCLGGLRRILDLSCGTGLTGVALACAGHDVSFTDVHVNLPTIQENVLRNLPNGRGPISASDGCGTDGATAEQIASNNVVGYSWGSPLPLALRRRFDIVACGDLLYHVWSGRLHNEFVSTLLELRRHGGFGEQGPEFVFAFQVRSGRQENQILENAAFRLGLALEELTPATEADADCPLHPGVRYRLVRLRSPGIGEHHA